MSDVRDGGGPGRAAESGLSARESSGADGSERRPTAARGGSRSADRSWTDGSRSSHAWGWEVLGFGLAGLGVGVLLSALAQQLLPAPAATYTSLLVLWMSMLVPVLVAFRRYTPRRLLSFQPGDIVVGITLGLLTRVLSGIVGNGAGGQPWPSYPIVDGALPRETLVADVIGAALVAPFVEEFFFRGVVLVAAFTALYRVAGRNVAAFAAILLSTGLFILTHSALGEVSTGDALGIFALSVLCGFFVVFTGRIWPAVLIHAVYNASWVALSFVGTALSAAT